MKAQEDADTIRYRSTTFHGSAAHFVLLGAQYPQFNRFFPSAALSLKSARTDSLYAPLKKINFVITMGAAASRYWFSDAEYFRNFLSKESLPVFSKRFWGGFGINFRRAISPKLILDVDVAPCIQIIVDKSEESRVDTSSWESKTFTEIYQGVLLYTNFKLEYRAPGNFAPFLTVSASVPLANDFAAAHDEKYHNQFKGQVFIGAGVTYYYNSLRILDPSERGKGKQ